MQTCPGRVVYPHGTTKGTEAEPHSLQQVLSGTTENFGPFPKEASFCPGGNGGPLGQLIPKHRLISGKLNLTFSVAPLSFNSPGSLWLMISRSLESSAQVSLLLPVTPHPWLPSPSPVGDPSQLQPHRCLYHSHSHKTSRDLGGGLGCTACNW